MHASRILHRDIKPANVLVSLPWQGHCRGCSGCLCTRSSNESGACSTTSRT
jgi:Fe-S cluster biogenesis protein NfuA